MGSLQSVVRARDMGTATVLGSANVTVGGAACDATHQHAIESRDPGHVTGMESVCRTTCASARLAGVDGGARNLCVLDDSPGSKHAVTTGSVWNLTNVSVMTDGPESSAAQRRTRRRRSI